MVMGESWNDKRLPPRPGREPEQKGRKGGTKSKARDTGAAAKICGAPGNRKKKDGGHGRADPRAPCLFEHANRKNPRADQTPDYRAAPLVEKREKGRYQTTAPLYNQAETEIRRRRFALAASKAHDHRSKNMGGLSRVQGGGLA